MQEASVGGLGMGGRSWVWNTFPGHRGTKMEGVLSVSIGVIERSHVEIHLHKPPPLLAPIFLPSSALSAPTGSVGPTSNLAPDSHLLSITSSTSWTSCHQLTLGLMEWLPNWVSSVYFCCGFKKLIFSPRLWWSLKDIRQISHYSGSIQTPYHANEALKIWRLQSL